MERDEEYGKGLQALRRQLSWKKILLAHAYNLFTFFYPFLPHYDFTFVLWVPFWVIGLWLARRERIFWPVAALLLYLVAIYTFFGGPASRYRQNFAPPFLLLSGLGMKSLLESFPTRQILWGSGGWLGLNILIWGISPLRASSRSASESPDMEIACRFARINSWPRRLRAVQTEKAPPR